MTKRKELVQCFRKFNRYVKPQKEEACVMSNKHGGIIKDAEEINMAKRKLNLILLKLKKS